MSFIYLLFNVNTGFPSLISAGFVVVTVLIFVGLAAWTPLLREEVSNNKEFSDNQQQQQIKQNTPVSDEYRYSLSKVQLGIWTMIISSSYIYLSLFKGDCAEVDINKTALVLLGIFSGTAAMSKIIDKREIKDQRPRHQNAPSKGFFTDILSDDGGISVHRFQHVVWTLVGVTVYVYKIAQIKTGCVLPELSDTLLALMGISSATFVAIRSKENDPEATVQPPATEPGNKPPPAPAANLYPHTIVTQQFPSRTSDGGHDFYG